MEFFKFIYSFPAINTNCIKLYISGVFIFSEIKQIVIDYLKKFYEENADIAFKSPWGEYPELRTQDINLCLYRVLDFRNRADVPDVTSMYHDDNQPPYR